MAHGRRRDVSLQGRPVQKKTRLGETNRQMWRTSFFEFIIRMTVF